VRDAWGVTVGFGLKAYNAVSQATKTTSKAMNKRTAKRRKVNKDRDDTADSDRDHLLTIDLTDAATDAIAALLSVPVSAIRYGNAGGGLRVSMFRSTGGTLRIAFYVTVAHPTAPVFAFLYNGRSLEFNLGLLRMTYMGVGVLTRVLTTPPSKLTNLDLNAMAVAGGGVFSMHAVCVRSGEFSCAVLFNQCCFFICAPRVHATHKYTHTHSYNHHAQTFRKPIRLAYKRLQAYVCSGQQSQWQIDPRSCS
jgi:hypothetical protein